MNIKKSNFHTIILFLKFMDANKIDVDALFKQYTIKEIQGIELQVKNEIEKKKEDLRIMV